MSVMGGKRVSSDSSRDVASSTAGVKYDAGKIPLELLPFDALTEVAKVLQFGAKKYAARNWEKGIEYGRLFGAATGHLWSWFTGEENDEETGLPHLAHAACDVLFLLAFVIRKKNLPPIRPPGELWLDAAIDDRPRGHARVSRSG